jgi:hypothetical protein
MTDPEELQNIDLEQLTKDELIEQLKQIHQEQLTSIIINKKAEENNSDIQEYPIEYLPGEICYSKGAVKELRSTILMHPDAYKALQDYKNQTPLQRFAWNIKWGFKDCIDNFRNWQGHMRGEDWDFWEILSWEWSAYE